MYKIFAVLLSVLLLTFITSCVSNSRSETIPSCNPGLTTDLALPLQIPSLASVPSQDLNSLRSRAQSLGISIGTAVAADPLRKDPVYAETIAREFNILTPENAMKFGTIHPGRNTYDFNDADTIVDFAEKYDISVHGHTLVWHNHLPKWLTAQTWSRDELIAILREHITTVVGHYRGRVFEWDVINEAVTDNGSLRDSIWLKGIGPEYIEMAFRWAHEADPNAVLFYNDYSCEGRGKKSDAVFELVRGLINNNVPIQGIGLQMHVRSESCPPSQDVAWNTNRLASLGLVVYITEMDVRIKAPTTEEKLVDTANLYSNMLGAFLSAKNSKAFIMWGFTDNFSWIPSFYPGWEPGLLFNKSYQPQPAYTVLNNLLDKHRSLIKTKSS